MKLGIINGSPRGRSGNSNTIAEWMTSRIKNEVEIHTVFAADVAYLDQSTTDMGTCDLLLVIFPLYTDAMSGYAKQFFEHMEKNKAQFTDKPVLFVIHSGFSELAQSRLVERYCEHFSSLLRMRYLGCVILGGSEAIRHAPEKFFKKKIVSFARIGQRILSGQPLSQDELAIPGNKESLSKGALFFLKHFTFLSDYFWNRRLKRSNVFDKRFDRPYL